MLLSCLVRLGSLTGKPCSRLLTVTSNFICGVMTVFYCDVFVPLSTVDSRRFSGPFVVVKVSQNSLVGKQMLLYFMLATEYFMIMFPHS